MAKKQDGKQAPIPPAVQHFDALPGSAKVSVQVVAALEGVSIPTVWRRARSGLLPPPQKIGGTTRWLVAALRAARAK